MCAQLAVLEEDPAGEEAQRLLRDFRREIAALYGPLDESRWPRAAPGEMSPPAGGFVVVREDRRAVACGGVKALEPPHLAEIKRMYVEPGARGRGHARRVLGALERLAAERGYDRVRLDTGRRQPEALHVYETSGYTRIPDYNGNLYASYWFEKSLTP